MKLFIKSQNPAKFLVEFNEKYAIYKERNTSINCMWRRNRQYVV